MLLWVLAHLVELDDVGEGVLCGVSVCEKRKSVLLRVAHLVELDDVP